MNSTIKLGIAACLPVIASVIFYLIDRKFNKKIKSSKKEKTLSAVRQIIIGVVFGGIAIIGTEWGIPMNGAMVNCRDAAPMCAGLFFGAPAGIIAGLIGGIERWIAVAWGVGSFTRLACSVSTVIAGLYAAFLRKYIFENKKPGWVLSLAVGLVMEVFHLTMVFITNINQIAKAASVVQVCTAPMLTANSLAVCASSVLIGALSQESLMMSKKERNRISRIIQKYLLVVVVLAFLIATVFTGIVQTNIAETTAENSLSIALSDTIDELKETSDNNLLSLTRQIASEVDAGNLELTSLAEKYGVSEINIVSYRGIIIMSTNSDYIGFGMLEGEQSEEFLCLLEGEESFVQSYGPISYDESICMKYAGVPLNSGFIQVGYNASQFQGDVSKQIAAIADHRHIGDSGFLIVTDESGMVISSASSDFIGVNLLSSGAVNLSSYDTDEMFLDSYGEDDYYVMYNATEGYTIIAVMPENDATSTKDVSLFISSFIQVLIFAVLFALIYILIKKVVIKNINEVNSDLAKITGGDLNVVVDVRENSEFESLSDDINSTVDTLKHYIDEAAARIDKELEFAKSIQASALPSVFPAFPQRKEFDIYARMDTAKEVGGDFYDFYFSHQNTLNVLIADVSGKGIPAALFMMRAKTQLKSLTESDIPIDEVFTRGNAGLCEGNDAGMFVTAWQGCINVNNGLVKFANAGHNPPVVKHAAGGKFEYLKSRAGLVLAGMDGIKYRPQELQLDPGDIIYLYTDGVTEATDANNELYGEDRLLDILNSREFTDMKDLCDSVKADVDKFVADAPQFDDITMLAFKYIAPPFVPSIHFDEAKIEDVTAVTEFVEAECEKLDVPMKAIMQIDIAIDEIYSNIVKFAYGGKLGPVTVSVKRNSSPNGVKVIFEDDGVPYNPLMRDDPDVTLSAEERQIGGLGIYMVKKSMDKMTYKYRNFKNVLKIVKYFEKR